MQMAEHSGTDGLFWYFRFNGNFSQIRRIFNWTDEITKNDFDGVSLLFFFNNKTRLFVLILKYNCFTHGPQMPEVRLFLKKKKEKKKKK